MLDDLDATFEINHMPDLENLFVIYPPGLGGNHFANILSLGKQFTPRFALESYDQNVNNAHFSYHREFNVLRIRETLPELTAQSNVFNGHWLAYLQFHDSELPELFPNKKFFAIQMPEPGTVAHDRITGGNPTAYNNYFMREITFMYQVPHMQALCRQADRPWYSVNPDLLFAPDLSALFADLAQQGFEIQVDMDLVNSLHAKWFNRL